MSIINRPVRYINVCIMNIISLQHKNNRVVIVIARDIVASSVNFKLYLLLIHKNHPFGTIL